MTINEGLGPMRNSSEAEAETAIRISLSRERKISGPEGLITAVLTDNGARRAGYATAPIKSSHVGHRGRRVSRGPSAPHCPLSLRTKRTLAPHLDLRVLLPCEFQRITTVLLVRRKILWSHRFRIELGWIVELARFSCHSMSCVTLAYRVECSF